ncbi:MAG: hypothetical protein ACXWAY_18345 [Acidimicrobiia bacterium]
MGNDLACQRSGDLLYVGGHGPIDGRSTVIGKVGTDLTLEQGRDCGRHTRSAVGLAALPFDVAVEIELVARVG